MSNDPILNAGLIGIAGAICLAFPWLFAVLALWLVWLAVRGVGRALTRLMSHEPN